ncbi:MAG: S-layer homology domain-containing protein, partial [Clostridia bacterium]|nr:S-layer homology domain-containing protein [Clostridia bacterium]
GEVKISVYSDHYEKRTEKNVLYVSKSFEETILSAIENAVSAEEVGNILTENEAELGINIKLDTLPVSDKNIVYIHLAGKSYDTISDLLCAYYSYAAIEDVNYATTARHINAVLSSEKICSVLEIETEKVNALSATNKTDFNKIFIDWPEEFNDVATLKKVFKDTIRIFMMKQYEKSDVSLTEDDFSVYLGEIIEHKICLVDDADDVKSITIRLKADDEKIFDGFDFENKSEFNCETELDDGILALTFEADDALSCEELGILTLRTSETGSYEIIQSGELLYDVGESFLVDGLIEESVLDVDVKKSKPSKGSGGGSSTSVPSSRPSANDVTQRPIENKEPENKPEKEKYKFSDLENHTWAKEAIDELLKTGIISESEDKKFNPSSNITREEFVKLVVCALGIETEGKTTGFADVASDAWYYEYVAAAENAGVVTGSDGKFGIGTLITREDMATILYRAVSEKLAIGQENELFGDDEVISPYAKEAVYAMRNNKIINGVGDNSFMPKNNATRAESAKMIYELIKVVNS